MNISSLSSSAMQRPDPSEMREKLFKTGDSDGNGSLNKTELTTAMANAPKPPMGGMKGPPPSGESKEAKSVDDIFAEMDADSDGEISTDEMTAFDEARETERQSQRQAGFTGSTDFLKTLLSQLDENSDDASSGVSLSNISSSDDQDARDTLIAKLIKKLQQQSSTYQMDGTTQSDVTGLFSGQF